MTSAARFLLLILLCVMLAGCQGYITERDKFWQIITTDYEGHVIAEWVAVGTPRKIEGGVRILAIAKKTFGPYPYEARYVIGRRVDVKAANVDVFRVAVPLWIRDGTTVVRRETRVTAYAK